MPSLGKFLRHQSQWNDKFQVQLQIHTAFGVKVSSASAQFFVQYTRGDHKGSTMKLNSTDPSSIVFDSSCCFTFPCTLYYYDVVKKDYEEKSVTVYFNEANGPDPTSFITHGKTNIDLSKYAKEVPLNSSKSFPLTEVLSKPKKGDALRLQVTLTLTCVCVVDPTKTETCATPSEEPIPGPLSTTPPPSTPPRTQTPPPTSTPISAPLSTLTTTPSHQNPPPRDLSSPVLLSRLPSHPIHIPGSPMVKREASASSASGLEGSNRARSDDGESISSFSSRNSPPSSPSTSPSSSPPRFSSSFDQGSNGSVGSNPLSSSSSSNVKSYLQSPPIKMHLLERQASDSLLNTSDIAMRLASKHPELCKSKDGLPSAPSSPALSHSALSPTLSQSALSPTLSHSALSPTLSQSALSHFSPPMSNGTSWLRASSDQMHAPKPSSPHRRALDFKNEGRMKSSNDLKSPMLQKALLQKQKDDEKHLIDEIIPMPPHYSDGIPILAYVLFRALLRWRSFSPTNSQFFESFFSAFNNLHNLSEKTDFTSVLLYRLSTAASLRHILQTELHILSSDNVSTVMTDFLRRLKKSLLSFYEMYYSQVKEELDVAIGKILENVKEGKAEVVIPVFEKHLKLITSFIPLESLQQQIIYQIVYYFNAQILNSLLKHTTPCQCAVGLGLKMLVLHIENWASTQNEPLPQAQSQGEVVQLQCDSMVGWVYTTCRKALSGTRQAADVLVVKKSTLIEPKIRDEVCPSLTPQQLLMLLEHYVPDEFDPEPMHPGVVKSIDNEIPTENTLYQTPSTQTLPPSPFLDASQPSPLDTHFTQPLSLSSLSIPSSITSHPSFAFLRDVCTDSNQTW